MPHKDLEKRKAYHKEYSKRRREDPEYRANIYGQNKEWFINNIDRAKRSQKNSALKRTYGLTLSQYEDLLSKQENVCAICNQTEKINKAYLAVDHCHTTGKVRGLLCQACNTTLGKVNEDITILQKMISYLKNHNENSGM